MKISTSILTLILLISNSIYCQTKFGNKWIIGMRGYNIDFNNLPITHDTTFIINQAFYSRGHSNICDSNENLIFSSDGMDVFDSSGNLMDNGDTIVPQDFYIDKQGWSSTAQTSLILPMANRKYYLVTPTVSNAYLANVWTTKPAGNWNYDLLLYNEIDMNANGGMGKVAKKKVTLMQNSPMKKTQMMACRHANGKDWWLLKMAGDSNLLFTFLFTQDSVYRYPDQNIPFGFLGSNDTYGQMQFNSDGTKWASTCNWINDITYSRSGDVFFADFDRCTGLLTNHQKFIAPPVGLDSANVGLSFSPNGKFLYISKYSAIQQLDLDLGTWFMVHGPDSPNYFCGYTSMQLAPDNKIYIGRFDGICKQISVIDSPDIKYNCNFCVNCLRSKSINGYFGTPPNMPNYELGSALPCWPVGNGEIVLQNKYFEIYPNPTSSRLYIKTLEKVKRELFSSVGQLLISTYNSEIDVSKYGKGVYYIKVGNSTKKVIIE